MLRLDLGARVNIGSGKFCILRAGQVGRKGRLKEIFSKVLAQRATGHILEQVRSVC